MKIGVIGGGGFIGKNICNSLLDAEHDVYSISKSNYEERKKIHYDVLINSNGNTKKYLAENNSKLDFEKNVVATMNSTVDFVYKRYIYLSTLDVFGDSVYGYHKLMAENYIENKCDNYIIFRLCSVIGPGMYKGVVFDIQEDSPVYLTKDSKIQVITTSELCNIIKTTLKMNGRKYNTALNICSKTNISVKEIGKFLNKKIQYRDKLEKQYYNYKPDLCICKTAKYYLKEYICKNG